MQKWKCVLLAAIGLASLFFWCFVRTQHPRGLPTSNLNSSTHKHYAMYCALDYLAMIIWLALWVMCFTFTLYCSLQLVIQCNKLALMWWVMLQVSLVHMCKGLLWDQLQCDLESTYTWSRNEAGVATLAALLRELLSLQFWLLAVFKANDGFTPGPYFIRVWVQYLIPSLRCS